MSFFDLRSMFRSPFACDVGAFFKDLASNRSGSKGRVGRRAGSRQSRHERKYARRREFRRLMRKATYDGMVENPAGSKLLRRCAKNAAFASYDEKGVAHVPTLREIWDWFTAREEAQERQGHQGFRIVRPCKGEEVRVRG